METSQRPAIVAIHCIRTGADNDSAVFAGANPFGPRGGRCGNVMDGECIARNLRWAEAVQVADEFVTNHPGTSLVLTASQSEGAKRIRDAVQPLPADSPQTDGSFRCLVSKIWRLGIARAIIIVSRLTVMMRKNSSSR